MPHAEVFAALADPTRRRIFEALRDQPMSVGALASGQPVSRPAVSQHLRVLEAAGLAQFETQGKRKVYSFKREGLDDLRSYLETFWSDALAAYADAVKRRVRQRR